MIPGRRMASNRVGSAITYLERYTLMAITGLAAADMDDDGQAAGQRPPEPTQQRRAPQRRQPAEQPRATIVPEGPPPPDDVLDAEVGPSASAPTLAEWEAIRDAIEAAGFQLEQVLPAGVNTINEYAKMFAGRPADPVGEPHSRTGGPGDLRTGRRLENLGQRPVSRLKGN